MENMPLYDEVPISEAVAKTGVPPISTRWVDHGKPSGVRCRWVARDMKGKFGERDRPDLFASMPPLEAKKLLFKMAASQQSIDDMKMTTLSKKKKTLKLMLIDVRKAHLNANCEEDVDVELLVGLGRPRGYGKLNMRLYGMERTAKQFEDNCAEKLGLRKQ